MIAIYYITLRLNLIHIPIERDEGIFGYMGSAILNGDLPYKDYFDTKPPLIFYIYAFMLLFVPQDQIGIHTFLHIYNFFTLITIYYTSKVLFNDTKAGLFSAFTYAAIIADFGLDVYRQAFLYHRLQSLQHPTAQVGPGLPAIRQVLLSQRWPHAPRPASRAWTSSVLV